jgi:hypothetical protein
MKGEDPPECNHSISSDVIFSERRGQSQKPEELYEMIEELVPNGGCYYQLKLLLPFVCLRVFLCNFYRKLFRNIWT